MVVQCPSCQSRFRIADDKVTDKGVRVRCTSCKNVFQVRKPGSQGEAPGPGSTMDLSALDAAQVRRAAARPAVAAGGGAAAAMPRPAAGPAARRLEADDLFGMSELTGDVAPPQPPAPPPPAPSESDELDLGLGNGAPRASPPQRVAPPVRPATPPPAPDDGAESSAAADPFSDDALGADALPAPNGEPTPVRIGAFKTTLKDPFEGMNLQDSPPDAPLEVARRREEQPPAPESTEAKAEDQLPPQRELVSSAMTGLVGAALALAVVIAGALSDDAAAGWLGLAGRGDVVATRVVSGLYDTVAGKPVFYVRGRVENRSKRAHGPVRVVAELVADGSAEAHAESIAGAEPNAEDVFQIRSAADAEKLGRALESSEVERKLAPGASLPFFAVIADPPADLAREKLHVTVELVDAWVPPQAKAAKGK